METAASCGTSRFADHRRAARRGLVCGALATLVCALVAPMAASGAVAGPVPVDRVLVISLPGVAWPDLDGADVPHLRQLFDQSALGALVTRTAGRRSSAGAGYLTIGAGGRTESDELLVGQAFEPAESYGSASAAEVFAHRTGRRLDHGLLHLGIEALIAKNAAGRFDPRLGALGDALARAHVGRAVIANGDGPQRVVDGSIPRSQRSAVVALMTHDGFVPEGDVGTDLVIESPGAPFGVRQDPDAVMRAFDQVWRPRHVVLVEASDLVRADLYGPFATAEQQRALKLDALARADALVGRLLTRVDSHHDAVFVIGPTSGRGGGLAVTALRASGVRPGLLRSATSRRTGIVYLADVAPTVLHLFGITRPAKMEGQAMVVRPVADNSSRASRLVRMSRDGLARDTRTTPISLVVVVLGGLLAASALLVLWRFPRGRIAVEIGALALLGFLASTYVAGPLNVGRSGNSAYWEFLFLGAVVFALACKLAGRGRPYAPLLIALGSTVALHLGDLLTGAHFEFNTVFGYSATVGIRTAGEGNLTFAQLAAATLFLSALIVWRMPSRRARYCVIGMQIVTLAVMVVPPFGDDFGAALSVFPAFALLAWLLLGHRVRLRTVGFLAAGVIAAGLLVGFADLLRPPDQRTHIGRFFSQVGRGGFDSLARVLRRKADANLASFSTARLMWVLPIVVAFGIVVWLSNRTPARRLMSDTPVFRHALAAFAVLVLLGYVLNDSGVSIPALMAVEFECVAAYVLLQEGASSPRRSTESAQVPLLR